MLGPAGRDPRPARPRRDPPRRVRRPRRLRPGDVPRHRHVRRPDALRPGRRRICSSTASPRSPDGQAGTKASSRAGRCGCTKDGPADLILKLGRIWTGDRAQPLGRGRRRPRRGDRRGRHGATDVARFRGPKTRVVDRPDAFAMPGLIDAHGHIESLGASQDEVDLRGVDRARRGRAAGQGADRRDARRLLDHGPELGPEPLARRRVPDRGGARRRRARPAGLAHAASTATPAGPTPRRCGGPRSRKDAKAPSDGQILRDTDGQPTGVFIDGAMGLVGRVIPGADARPTSKRRILAGAGACAPGRG